MLLWEEYRVAHEGRRTWAYTQFCERYRAYTRTLRRSVRQQHRDAALPGRSALDDRARQHPGTHRRSESVRTACRATHKGQTLSLDNRCKANRFRGDAVRLPMKSNGGTELMNRYYRLMGAPAIAGLISQDSSQDPSGGDPPM